MMQTTFIATFVPLVTIVEQFLDNLIDMDSIRFID